MAGRGTNWIATGGPLAIGGMIGRGGGSASGKGRPWSKSVSAPMKGTTLLIRVNDCGRLSQGELPKLPNACERWFAKASAAISAGVLPLGRAFVVMIDATVPVPPPP